jgi:hypothetical protein
MEQFDPYDESISPDEWARRRNEQLASRSEPPQTGCLFWLESNQDLLSELKAVWKERMEKPATKVLLEFVNLGDAPEQISNFRSQIPKHFDIARESDETLLSLRDELRSFWEEVWKESRHSNLKFGSNEEVARTLFRWWKHYDMESDGWKVFYEAGQYLPTQKNFRGTIARILYEKRKRLTKCANCARYFIAIRSDYGKHCDRPECQDADNRERQDRFRENKKSKRRARKDA